jgi:uncharacterized membrane protein
MTPLIVLVVSFIAFLIAGRLGLRPLRRWVVALRWSLALMFLLTASAHFGSQRPDLVRMVPPAFGDAELLVTLTGIAELLGAIGLLVPRTAPWAAGGLLLLLLAMFPANIQAARHGLTIGGRPVTPLGPRTAMQGLFIAATAAAGFAGRRKEAAELHSPRDGARRAAAGAG